MNEKDATKKKVDIHDIFQKPYYDDNVSTFDQVKKEWGEAVNRLCKKAQKTGNMKYIFSAVEMLIERKENKEEQKRDEIYYLEDLGRNTLHETIQQALKETGYTLQ